MSERPDLAPQGRSAAELAEHWYQAGRTEEAYAASLAAADEARAVFAYGEELRHLQRALDLRPIDDPQRLELLERAVDAAMPAGQAARGLEHADAALELIDEATDPERAVAVLLNRSHFRSRLDLGGDPTWTERSQLLPPDKPTFQLGVTALPPRRRQLGRSAQRGGAEARGHGVRSRRGVGRRPTAMPRVHREGSLC